VQRAAKLSLCLVEKGERPSVNLQARQMDHYFRLDTEVRFFGKWEYSSKWVDRGLADLDASTGLFLPRREKIGSVTRLVVDDDAFSTRMRFLAWGFEQATGTVGDSDGDGFSDDQEKQAGTDTYDSESRPPHDPFWSTSQGEATLVDSGAPGGHG
jgi:hypothetical protein